MLTSICIAVVAFISRWAPKRHIWLLVTALVAIFLTRFQLGILYGNSLDAVTPSPCVYLVDKHGDILPGDIVVATDVDGKGVAKIMWRETGEGYMIMGTTGDSFDSSNYGPVPDEMVAGKIVCQVPRPHMGRADRKKYLDGKIAHDRQR